MNVYRRLGDQIGTIEARELAQQLVDWHDAMVKHARVVGPRRTTRCDEECPHDEAATLWMAARAAFGHRARELAFLRAHGHRSRAPIRVLDRTQEELRL